MKKAPFLKTILTISAVALLASCATPEERAASAAESKARVAAGKGDQVDKICFAGSIRGFSETTRNTVVVRRNARDSYLIETRGCSQLEHAQRLAIDETGSCVRRGDRLIVSDDINSNSAGLGPERCYINAIYKWDDPDRQEMAEEKMDDDG